MDDGGEPFQCQICLEIAYKPVVQACGHIFCFWCLHRAMDSLDTSHCPLCRSPYQHLPRVCELLHYLLLKALPKEYKERAEEVLEQEREMGTFSPQLGTLDLNGQESKVLELEKEKGTLSSQLGTLDSNGEANEVFKCEKEKGACSPQLVTLDLNGQVSAGTSISERKLRNMFAVEYAEREKSMLVQNKQPKEESPTDETAEASCQKETVIHVGVGCDNCGLYPIMGKRRNARRRYMGRWRYRTAYICFNELKALKRLCCTGAAIA
ncbi:hypothetical protein SUGI_0591470 [Cryptomeria japonica]|nr:hypothetical protein SUGI_0591470 [Cryptomeria japonica]